MKKLISACLSGALVTALLSGCQSVDTINPKTEVHDYDFTFQVQPETFDITLTRNGVKEKVSKPLTPMRVTRFEQNQTQASWEYPDQKIRVNLTKQKTYLDVRIQSTGASKFEWPVLSGKSYTLPLWEGKQIPSRDPHWQAYLGGETYHFSEDFSMRFLAANLNRHAVVFIADDIFNDQVTFQNNPNLELHFSHEFPTINKKKTYGFRLYLTDQDPTQIVKIYRRHIQELGEFKSLVQKAKENRNVAKLFGAPHIYLWNDGILTDSDLRWQKLDPLLKGPTFGRMVEVLNANASDSGQELAQVIKSHTPGAWDRYQKQVIVRALNTALKLKTLYEPKHFPHPDKEARALLSKGIDKLSEQELYTLNKHLLKSALGESVTDVQTWGEGISNLIREMSRSGLNRAWIGLPNWADGLMNPVAVNTANKTGYLIGPYDSYHSIHKEQNMDWNTASFKDPILYERATITDVNGQKVKGFLGRGRKLNPTLSLPAVNQRVRDILKNGIAFNSWFVDCDATGEIYDDYTPEHLTTQAQDLQARLKRMNVIATRYRMVVGSEGGNDFASRVIAFAHGIETPVIAWSDKDMRQHKQSPYYIGAYWSQQGGTPDRFGKPVPIKERYQHIYLDPVYSIPLYKLVYNDSVITTHHWEWGSLKIKGEVSDRMLKELLYNVPPLYHVDERSWQKDKELISAFIKVWSPFHREAVQRELTSFNTLSPDRLVQETRFGKDMRVIANFSTHAYSYQGETIPAKSAVIYTGTQKQIFNAAQFDN
ncbi:glycosyl hydrolase family 101 [Laceyella sediminis]|uniref:Glycosyl hydrolase family 101 n=1 Tax=Laceyella sediminis TaxID=573074 RepID=A0ABX5EKZ7_9BACL|nr:glycoside hydrolase [Laceyella sediminis]PRZ12500.1 glycosyl hydrolase family 101 [Laceyella sediminis]